VMLSTRDHGFVRPQYPMRRQFNYVICAVKLDGKTMLLDATEKYLPYDVLPSRCLNGQGLVISKTNHGWIDITSKVKAKTVVIAAMTLNPEGELKCQVTYSRDGYDAQQMRETYNKEGEGGYVQAFAKSKQWQIEKTAFQDVKEVGKSVKEIHDVTIAEHISPSGDVMYVNPFLTGQMDENPFKSETRTYPVDYGSLQESVYMLQLTLPEGFSVDELPKSQIYALPQNAGKYLFSATQLGNKINLNSTFQINKNTFTQAEYPILREFYNQIIAKQAEQVVLKKK